MLDAKRHVRRLLDFNPLILSIGVTSGLASLRHWVDLGHAQNPSIGSNATQFFQIAGARYRPTSTTVPGATAEYVVDGASTGQPRSRARRSTLGYLYFPPVA